MEIRAVTAILAFLLVVGCSTIGGHGAPPDGLVIADSAAAIEPLQVGGTVPDVKLSRLNGQAVHLRDVLGGKPAVLVFFRGSWCPFCTQHMAGLEKVYAELGRRGYSMVAIAPDSADRLAELVDKDHYSYTLLSDSSMAAISAFGLAFKLDEETVTKYRGYGIPLTPAPGTIDMVLPVPAVYLVSAAGRVTFVHTDPDYKKRLDPQKILAAAGAE